MANDLRDKLKGTHCNETSDIDDANHVVNQTKVFFFNGSAATANSGVGQYAQDIPLFVADTDLTLTAAYILPSAAETATANHPDLAIAQGDIAATAVTVYDTFDGTGTNFVAMTAINFTIAPATDVVAKGEVLYLHVTTNGTPIDYVKGFSIVVKYRLDN